MHAKYQRRFTPHAERDSIPDVQTRVSVGPTTIIRTATLLSTDSVGSIVATIPRVQTLTQLATATIVETRSASSLSSVTASATSSSVALPQKSTSASSNSSQPSQSSQFSSTTSSSTLPISSSPTVGPGQNNGGAGQSSSSNMMPGGTIAAIFMACLIVIILSVLFVMRARSKINRINRRPLWMRRTIDAPLGISSDSYEPKLPSYLESQHNQYTAPPPVPPVPQWAYTATVPPNAYNSETVVINPSVINANPNLISTPQAVYTLGPNGKRSAFEATVTMTFTTTLPDELVVEVGQLLRVMAEYDDGWGLCMNERGEQGMVPIGYLDRGTPEVPVEAGEGAVALASPTSVKKAMWRKRSSSLRP